MHQLVYYKILLGGWWALFVIRSVFEYEHASLRPRLLSPFSPLAPSFNLISPASTATFCFRPLRKCPHRTNHCHASANCMHPRCCCNFGLFLHTVLCFAQVPSLHTSHLLAPLLASAAAAAFYCCCLLFALGSRVGIVLTCSHMIDRDSEESLLDRTRV